MTEPLHAAISLEPLVEAIAERVTERVLKSIGAPSQGYLDVDGAAEYLACHDRRRLYELVRQKRLEPRRDGRRLLFRREDLDACLIRDAA